MFELIEPKTYYKSSEKMEEIENNSIQLIATSPPYGKIKNYGTKEQIGYFDSFNDYFQRLKNVWEECYRVLEPQCRMVINIGDQYLRTSEYERYRVLSIASKIIEDCVSLGFYYLGDIIWQKISTTNTTGGCTLMGSIYYPRNGLLTYDYEHILIFKKIKGPSKKIEKVKKELSKISLSEWKKWFIGHWKFPGITQKEHIAMFPEELPYRLIRMFSLIGDKVLDPFAGSGTTLKVAKSLFRAGVGYEVNEAYKNILKQKVNEGKIGYYRDYQYLLYKLYIKSPINGYKFSYDKQKQKGIIVLKDNNDKEIVIDYLLIDKSELSSEDITMEIKNKMKENTIVNYLSLAKNWETFINYVIVVNSNGLDIIDLLEVSLNQLKDLASDKKISIIDFNKFISDDYDFQKLFS